MMTKGLKELLLVDNEELQLQSQLEQVKLEHARAGRDDCSRTGNSVSEETRGPKFDAYRASKQVPKFDDKDIDEYLTNFEKVCLAYDYPRDQWRNILHPLVSGKALKAFNHMTVDEVRDYDIFKECILSEYKITSEVLHAKFRISTIHSDETYCDFAKFVMTLFNKWIHSAEASNDLEKLKQTFMLEQFYESSRESIDMKLHIIDKKPDSIVEAGRYADEYAAIHKTTRPHDASSKFSSKHSYSKAKATEPKSNFTHTSKVDPCHLIE